MVIDSDRIVSIEWACLTGERPRHAGANARLGPHGKTVRVPLARLTAESGAIGFGWSRADRETGEALLGRTLGEVFNAETGVPDRWRAFDIPLWDLAAKAANKPVYSLAAAVAGKPVPDANRTPAYDTSLYFDDLHLTNDQDAADFMASEARDGYAAGHRAFKIKVGRGGLHMDVDAGMRRDIAVVETIRLAVGRDAPLLVDANNGWNLNLTRQFLKATVHTGIYWVEEPFHEDAELYHHLKEWMKSEGLMTLVSDGEGDASPQLLRWAREGLIDVVQYDIFGYGFSRWLALGRELDEWGVRSAPHHYGAHLGNYITCHLAPAIERFTFVEWDEVITPGIDGTQYKIDNGFVIAPNAPGFGLLLDDDRFRDAVSNGGWALQAK